MKKIGIITYHRAYNYGSVLQAYALNKFLNNNGFDTKTIDLKTKQQSDIYKLFEKLNSPFSIVRNIQSLIYYNSLKKSKTAFDKFIKDNISITNQRFQNPNELEQANFNYDYYICGSDQIWNANCTDFVNSYLLSFVKDKNKCISYAASIGTNKIPKDKEPIFKAEISNFKAISLREKKGAEIITGLTKREATVVLDPVFLLDKNEWRGIEKHTKVKKPYIFCYFIGDVDGMRDFAKKMNKQLKLPLVVVYKNIRDMLYINKKQYSAGPAEFLSLLENAEYICTNSFHAVAFSLIFQKKFWAFIDEAEDGSCKSRIINICELTGLENRVLTKNSCDVSLESEIEFHSANMIIEEQIKKSKKFLYNNLREMFDV